MKNQIKSGILISYITIMISNIIPMIYTPVMLRLLGQAEYGVYGISQSISNYLYLLNMGLGNTIIRYLAKYRASGEREQEELVAGMFVKIYSIISLIIVVCGTVIAININHYDNALTTAELIVLRKLVILNTVNMAFFMPFNVISSILVAHEEYIVNKAVALVTTILTPIFNLMFLYAGWGSIGFPIVTIITNIIGYCVYVPYAIKKIGIRPRFGKTDWSLVKEIAYYTIYVFLARIVDAIFWSTDSLIIGWSIGSVSAAVYNIGTVFNGHVASLSNVISSVLVPKLTTMEVKNADSREFTDIFIRLGRLQFIVVSFIISAFVVFGQQFISLWVGESYKDSYWVAICTMLPSTISMIQNTGVNILFAKNKHRFRAISYYFVAILNIFLTFVWVKQFGIVGAAFATCIACLVGDGVIMNWYYASKIGINISAFWKNILGMSPVMIFMGICAWQILSRIEILSWFFFLKAAIIYTIVYFGLAYAFMMNDYERNIIISPIQKILTFFKSKF